MQGLVQLYPNIYARADRHGGEVPDLGDLAERFGRLLTEGLLRTS
jgi:hypothetical protein